MTTAAGVDLSSTQGESQHLIFHTHSPTSNAHNQGPGNKQQNRWKHLSFQVDFYCYLGTIQSHSTSLYLITVINLKSLLFDVSTKSIPPLNHARLRQQTLISLSFHMGGNNLPSHSFRKLWAKAAGRCSAGLRA